MVQTLAGISRIERHISAAGLEYRHQRDDHADATLHAQRHAIFRSNPQRDQMMRKPIRARIELPISERLIFEDQRDCIGLASGMLLEELMDAQIRRIARADAVPCFDQQRTNIGRQHVELVHRRPRRLFERLHETRQRLLHIAAQLLRRQRRNGLRSEFETVAVVIHRKRQRIVGPLFGTEQFDAVESFALIRRALIVAIVEQGAEERRGRGDTAASLSECERRMLMLQQGCEAFMRVTHAVGDCGTGYVEANRQRIDQQPQRLIDARLHAPEQHGAEHDASIGVDRAARVQHARPGEMTEARETYAEASGLRAQT
ncbi:hypothetical protein NK8_53340 (plasmid) [Caballeronia sp. NK8]|nr:hypothetical protein NK8_53340 [Caballeronia sp. NK8]